MARYELDGLPNEVIAAEYGTTLPLKDRFASETERAWTMLVESTASYAQNSGSSKLGGVLSS